jgi:CubicO group peptidase (beta-lactamase class C family)
MRVVSLFLIAVLLFFQAIPTASAQTANPYQTQIAEFEEFVKKQMAADKIPGLSVGFIKDDFVWAKGFGYADLENKSPAKAESMYRMASVTKPMTATAVLQLVEKGKIALDAEVQTYVPYFPKKKFPVTIRQLLGHLGGISHYKNYDLEGHFKDQKNTRESIAVFENFDLVNEPGTRYFYSSYGYNLLGAVIEGASGQSYASYMTENVWRPLGMNDTRLDNPTDLIPNRVRGYQLVNNQIKNSEFIDISSRFAAGGIRSTVVDMLKFGKGIHEGKALSKASLDLMYNPMTTKSGDVTYYSTGWGTFPLNGRFSVSHSGGQQETSTLLYSFPTRKLTIAVAANLEGANNIVYIQKLFELLTGEAWNTNAYVADARTKVPLYLAMQGTFEEGRAHFEKTGKTFSDDKETAQAFALFNQSLNNETLGTNQPKDILQKIRQGRSLTSGPFIKIGSYMAMKLQEKFGAERLAAYSNTGAITFFNDYIQLKDIPKEFRFNESVEKNVIAWQQSWIKTNTAAMRQLVITPNTNFDELGAQLCKDFSGALVYPNFSDRMVNALQQLAIQLQREKALKVGELATELYPGLDPPNAFYGIMLVLSNEKEKGKQFLKRAVEINGNSAANASGLNTMAYNMERVGMRDAGIALLQTAIELYPQEANLYDSLGDFYSKKGRKEKAIEFYKKALEINPNYPNAENARAILKKLEN